MDLYITLDLKSNPVNSSYFENNFKQTTNCPATRVNMNEPSKQRTVTYVTHQWRSCHESFVIYCYVTNVTAQRQCQPEWKQMEISVTQASNGFILSE